jgi:hypothetical protein
MSLANNYIIKMVTGCSRSYDHHQTIEHQVFTRKLYNIPLTNGAWGDVVVIALRY